MTVTMRDIAKAAGVSITTVSHVINETRPVAPKTRERVLAAIDELQYYVNSSARLLVRGYSDSMGLIVSDIENPFFPQLIRAFEQACHQQDLGLVLGMTNYERSSAAVAVRRMIEANARGVAIMSTDFDSKLVERLLNRGIPVVSLDRRRLRENESSVRIDYSLGVRHAAEYLSSLGHQKIAIVHGPTKVLSANRYRKLLLSAAAEYGLEVVKCIEVESRPTGGATAARQILRGKTLPSAIMCGNDLIALGALGHFGRAGVDVPGDISIIGSDDIAVSSYCYPSLSTVCVHKDEVGLQAFRLLQKMLRAKQKNKTFATEVKTEFIARESTGPARHSRGQG